MIILLPWPFGMALALAGFAVAAAGLWLARRSDAAVRRTLNSMSPDERREWRGWWLEDRNAAEDWLRKRVRENL